MKREGIDMLDALLGNPLNFFTGTKYTNTQSTDAEYFEYELLNDVRKTYGTVINNLIKTQGRTTIKTNWDLDWQVRQIVIDQNGIAYKIQEVVKMPLEVNPQSNYLLNNPNTDFVLSLVKISNPMEKR